MTAKLPLLALAVGAFGIGVTEFSPMGMLPLMADDLGASIPAMGLVVSAYALGVLFGAPVMTLATAGVPRRRLLIGLMAIFTIGNLMAALADSYAMLVAARLVTALNHGAFFGVGSVVAANLVRPERRSAAVATMFSGLTVAAVAGGPLAAWMGEVGGWRSVFWAIAGVGVVAMASLRLALPPLPADARADMRSELRVLARPPVLAALALTTISFSAMFTVFTYLVPILRIETGAATFLVSVVLFLHGVGLMAGNWLGGELAGRSVDGTILRSLTIHIAVLVLFAWGMRSPLPATGLIVLWGVACFAIVSPLQVRVMEAAAGAPNLASAMNIGAFNLANAIGAALGGFVIDRGLGYPAVSLAGAGMAGAGLLLLVLLRRERRPKAAPAT